MDNRRLMPPLNALRAFEAAARLSSFKHAAEELGVTRANVRELAAHAAQDIDPERRFLLGGSKQMGSALELDDGWAARVIEATGNYGEMYERDLGGGSAVKLPRGMNKLERNGGLMEALPFR